LGRGVKREDAALLHSFCIYYFNFINVIIINFENLYNAGRREMVKRECRGGVFGRYR